MLIKLKILTSNALCKTTSMDGCRFNLSQLNFCFCQPSLNMCFFLLLNFRGNITTYNRTAPSAGERNNCSQHSSAVQYCKIWYRSAGDLHSLFLLPSTLQLKVLVVVCFYVIIKVCGIANVPDLFPPNIVGCSGSIYRCLHIKTLPPPSPRSASQWATESTGREGLSLREEREGEVAVFSQSDSLQTPGVVLKRRWNLKTDLITHLSINTRYQH